MNAFVKNRVYIHLILSYIIRTNMIFHNWGCLYSSTQRFITMQLLRKRQYALFKHVLEIRLPTLTLSHWIRSDIKKTHCGMLFSNLSQLLRSVRFASGIAGNLYTLQETSVPQKKNIFYDIHVRWFWWPIIMLLDEGLCRPGWCVAYCNLNPLPALSIPYSGKYWYSIAFIRVEMNDSGMIGGYLVSTLIQSRTTKMTLIRPS